MGITIKKKITVKTIRTGGVPGEGGELAEGAGAPGAGSTLPDGAEVLTTGPVAQAPVYSGPGRKPVSYTTAGVFAIITTIMFLVLIALQYFEWDTYTGCFPQTGPGAIGTRPIEPVGTEVVPTLSTLPPALSVSDEKAKEAPTADTPK